jgi:hypothetical protein
VGSTFAHRSPHSDRSHTIAHSRTLTRECKRACACMRAGMHVRGHTQTYTQTPSASPLRHGAHALSLCPSLTRVPRPLACTHARTRMHARTHAHTSAYSRRVVIGRMDVGVGEYTISGKQISDIAPVANASRSAQHSAWRVTFALAHSECARTCARRALRAYPEEGRQREARRTICRTRCAGASMRARRSSRPTASRSWRSRRAPLPDRCDRGLRPSRRRSRAGVRTGVLPV